MPQGTPFPEPGQKMRLQVGGGGSSGFAAGVMYAILKLWSLWVLSAAHPLPSAWVDFQFTTMNCKRLTILIKETCKSFCYEC